MMFTYKDILGQDVIKNCLLMLFILFYPAFAVAQNPDLRLIYSSDFQGELKPCGCSEAGNLGGVLRRATKFEALRQADIETLFVSAGDILGPVDEQGDIKNRYMLKAHGYLGLDALLPGERDLLYPPDVLSSYGLPWLLTNGVDTSPFPRHRSRNLGSGQRVLLLGLLDPGMQARADKKWLTEPGKALEHELAKVKASKADVVILMLHGKPEFAQRFRRHALIDVIVRGHLDEPVSTAPTSPIPPILAAGHRGQRIGIANLQITGSTRVIDNKIIPLPSSIKDHAGLAGLYQQYNRDIAAWYRIKTQQMKGAADMSGPYAGAAICQQCHQDIHAQWQGSRHAHALESLVKENKDADPECLLCHNTGMGTAGGFISPVITPDHTDVQCEACHGAARKHAEYPLQNKAGAALGLCTTCHTRETSPAFKLSEYFPKIAHASKQAAPIHRQSVSAITGLYDVLESERAIIDTDAVVLTEFFNFYCSRCYVFSTSWSEQSKTLPKQVRHRQIPIIFGDSQQPWAALAYLVAEQHGKGDVLKDAIFKARFEHNADIGQRQVIIDIAGQFNLASQVRDALYNDDSGIEKKFAQGMQLKHQYDIHVTPTIMINDNLRVLPKHTGNNTNLMVDNLVEILLDIQCRQYALCAAK